MNFAMNNPPEGFTPHFRRSAVTDPWEPLFSRRTQNAIEIGFVIGAAHCNSRGFLHGGVVASLADNAMGLSCATALGQEAGGLVTVGLSVDYIAAAKMGGWLQITPRILRAKGGVVFADALAVCGGENIARASAGFRSLARAPA
jgi:uncharacterized protein (TIGR00369 family)